MLAIVYPTITGMLALAQLLNSPFADDSDFTYLLTDTQPPTLTIQQFDAFAPVTNEPFRPKLSDHPTAIRVIQPHRSLLNPAAIQAIKLLSNLQPTGMAISWLIDASIPIKSI